MTDQISWTLIRNPRASSGKGEKKWPKIKSLLQESGIAFEEHVTTRPEHAMELAEAAARAGKRHFIAVGGDGTVNEVVNGMLRVEDVDAEAFLLGQIPVGTGNDWGKTVGIPKKMQAAVAQFKAPPVYVQDVGEVEYEDEGQMTRRFFVNIAGMGYDAFVGQDINARKARGQASIMGYVSGLLSCLMKYNAQPTTILVDEKAHAAAIIIANTDAEAEDGALGMGFFVDKNGGWLGIVFHQAGQ
ncbi:MAG: diacylglycerol kinase family protein [Bacteroidota bacterium]